MNPDFRRQRLASFAQGPARLGEKLAACPAGALDFKPGPAAWSIREIVFHLMEGELNYYTRARFIMAEPGVMILPYDQDRWVATLDLEACPLEEALEILVLVRRMLVRRLETLPEAPWAQSVVHPALGELTLDRWLEVLEPHIPAHLDQIQRNLEAWRG